MSADVRDILDLERPMTPEVTKESLLNKQRKPIGDFNRTKTAKRPEKMHREVYALLYNDTKDAPPLLQTDTGSGYHQVKARLGMKKTRKWEWSPFKPMPDAAILHHWIREGEVTEEYRYAKFYKQLNIVNYTVNEYNTHLRSNQTKWSKAQTDHLFDLARRYDLRFVVMADRWDRANFGMKTVEDLKERYYEVVGILTKLKGTEGDKKIFVYDAEHERKRKEQMKKLLDRTPKDIEEEQMLLNELKKIEQRKKERDRKTQDLQKLISQADQQGEAPATPTSSRKQEKKINKKKLPNQVRPSRVDFVVNAVESAGIKFNELRGTGVSARSQKMKLPANVGQKKAKALEQALAEFKLDPAPPPTEEICNAFNEVRSDLVLLSELRQALATCTFELESLKHQYETACPGKTLSIPASLVPPQNDDSMTGISDSTPGTPSTSHYGGN